MSLIGYFRSIVFFYQQYYNYIDLQLNEMIENGLFDFSFFNQGRDFLIRVLQNNNFITLTVTEMKLELLKIQTINKSIHSFFYTKPKFFISQEVQIFYQISNDFESKLKSIIDNITINYIGISNIDNLNLQSFQRNYRSYILETFWLKYYENLKKEDSVRGSSGLSIEPVKREKYPIWNIEILYNKPKVSHFDWMSSQFKLYSIKQKDYIRKGKLFFYGFPEQLRELKNPPYTHNMIVKEINPKLEFSINHKDNIFYIKYDINNMKDEENNVKRIFIYAYSFYKSKKLLIGFAFRNNDDYQLSYKKYYNYILN
jgi:hypothetical protein